MKLVIDTDKVINLLRDKNKELNPLAPVLQKHACFITAITLHEIVFGIEYRNRNLDTFKTKVLPLFVDVLPFNKNSAFISANIESELTKKGITIGIKDILIGSICLQNDLPIFTDNTKHFSKIPGLKILSIEELA
jgi:tRNA(fMet)-specific endonuclease VapC